MKEGGHAISSKLRFNQKIYVLALQGRMLQEPPPLFPVNVYFPITNIFFKAIRCGLMMITIINYYHGFWGHLGKYFTLGKSQLEEPFS